MDYEFNAEELQEENYIDIKLPDNITLHIYKGDIGYSVDFANSCGDVIYEMGYVLEEDLIEENDEEDEQTAQETFSILIETSTNDETFDKYDTTISIFKNDKKYDGFLSLKYNNETDEELVKFAQQFYPEIKDDCKVIWGFNK